MHIEELVTGYQYGDSGKFIGIYKFPNNKDKEEIHVPPFTTLTPPPSNIPKGLSAYFRKGTWELDDDENPHNSIKFEKVLYSTLLPEYLQDLKDIKLYDRLIDFYKENPELMDVQWP
jgi:hypothetical protein